MAGMHLVILKKRAEFQRVRGGTKWSGRGFLAEGRPRSPVGSTPVAETRFGFTVSKKMGNAVARNRIRRRIKEALRLMPLECAPPAMDVVIVARRAALDMPFAALASELTTALDRMTRPGSDGPKRSELHGKRPRQSR